MFKALLLIFLTLSVFSCVFGFPPRIINGTDALEGEFPFMVSLRRAYDETGEYKFTCGASIIGRQWILTAAHCLLLVKSPSELQIGYGVTNLAEAHNTIMNISEFILHENYSIFTKANDIALLKLKYPLKFNKNIKKINLQEDGQHLNNNENVTLAGWGTIVTQGNIIDRLQKVDLKVFSQKLCSELHSREIFESNICAGGPDGFVGQCNGDSGGPLIYKNIQVGIVSWSVKPCAIYPYPGVYTRVSSFRDWIKKKTGI